MSKITLKNLPDATAQEVLDQAVEYFINNPKRCGYYDVDSTFICTYRDEHGNTCAGGDFVSEEDYSPEMEELSWFTLVKGGLAPVEHKYLINNLQTIHDDEDYHTSEERLELVKNKLKDLAEVNSLNFDSKKFIEAATPIWI